MNEGAATHRGARPAILLASALPDFFESDLLSRFEVYRWSECANPDDWLQLHGNAIRAVVTGASIGVPVAIIRRLPSLGIIAIFGAGYDAVDVAESRRLGIRVTNTPDVLTDDVADLALGLIVALLRQIPAADHYVKSGRWPHGPMPLSSKVTGRRFGIVGLGRIGKAIANRLACLGSVAYTGTQRQPLPYEFVGSITELARSVSILVIAASANASTRHLVGRDVLNALGPDGYLVNVSRGMLVDESELIAALQDKRIAGAALDVFADEPIVPEGLRSLSNVILTPHIGSATSTTREAMARSVLANLDAFFAGKELPSPVA